MDKEFLLIECLHESDEDGGIDDDGENSAAAAEGDLLIGEGFIL